MTMRIIAAAVLLLAACGGGAPHDDTKTETNSASHYDKAGNGDAAKSDAAQIIGEIAEEFVRLGLELGTYDKAYVDAYHGPAEWREAATASPRSLDEIIDGYNGLIDRLGADVSDPPQDLADRVDQLTKQIIAGRTRAEMAMGRRFSFDEETRLLYDAVAPQYDIAEFDAALVEIDALLPGDGALSERVDAFRESLAIPKDRLSDVFDAAIAECRRRTLEYYSLPDGEGFDLGYVTDKPWSGYNWYQGDYVSLIEINTDLPIIIDRAVDLGCHEGYPGHHTWNVLVERDFLRKNGWIEYAMFPLFSPQALIGEGTANYGIELAFPDGEKTAFDRDVLFPLAGLDPAKAQTLATLNKARRKLSHARNHIAREYLDGRIDRETAIAMSTKYGLSSRARAEQSVTFIETYRGYVLNYNLGQDLVAAYIDAMADEAGGRWAAFENLLTVPLSASDLQITSAD